MISYLVNLYASLQFWWVKKTLKEGRDFRCDYDDDKLMPIFTICRGAFSGVKFIVVNMRVEEDHRGAVLNFETRIVDTPISIKPYENPKLEKALIKLSSNIVRLYLLNYVEQEKKNESRKTDTVSVDDEREFYEEGSSVPEGRVPARRNRKKSVSDDTESHRKVQRTSKSKRTKNTTGRTQEPNGE